LHCTLSRKFFHSSAKERRGKHEFDVQRTGLLGHGIFFDIHGCTRVDFLQVEKDRNPILVLVI
jgi:hypothetical protein